MDEYKQKLSRIDCAEEIHHLHIWSLDGEKLMATLHVKLREDADLNIYKKVKSQVENISREAGIEHLTVQIDVEECCDNGGCGF